MDFIELDGVALRYELCGEGDIEEIYRRIVGALKGPAPAC